MRLLNPRYKAALAIAASLALAPSVAFASTEAYEDVADMVLNFKQVRLKQLVPTETQEKVSFTITGQEQFKAGEPRRPLKAPGQAKKPSRAPRTKCFRSTGSLSSRSARRRRPVTPFAALRFHALLPMPLWTGQFMTTSITRVHAARGPIGAEVDRRIVASVPMKSCYAKPDGYSRDGNLG